MGHRCNLCNQPVVWVCLSAKSLQDHLQALCKQANSRGESRMLLFQTQQNRPFRDPTCTGCQCHLHWLPMITISLKNVCKIGVSGTSGLFIRWTFRHLGEASGHRQVESWNTWTVGQVDDLVLGNVLGLIEKCWKKLGEFRSSEAPPRFDCQSPCQSISIQINPSRWFQLNSSRPFLKFPATGGTGAAGAGFGAFGDDGLTCTINIINIAIPQAARASNPTSLWAAPSDLALPDIPQTWKLCSHQSQRDT